MLRDATASESPLPPIVLLLDDERAQRDEYEAVLSDSGLWVSAHDQNDEAIEWAVELNPDAIVARVRVPVDVPQGNFVRRLRALARSPLLLVADGGRGTGPAADTDVTLPCDTWVRGPLPPRALHDTIRQVLQRSHEARERSAALRQNIPGLLARSRDVMDRSARLRDRTDERRVPGRVRPCPGCGAPLHWYTRRQVDGVPYDYYPPCTNGCGLFAYNPRTGEFQRLA